MFLLIIRYLYSIYKRISSHMYFNLNPGFCLLIHSLERDIIEPTDASDRTIRSIRIEEKLIIKERMDSVLSCKISALR